MLWCIFLFFIFHVSQGYIIDTCIINGIESSEYAIPGLESVNAGAIPRYFDWRTKNAVTPVKNQQTCEACWAFSIVAAVESHLKIHQGMNVDLSEQFLIDCDPDRTGCDTPVQLLQSYSNVVNVLGGILREVDYYPYNNRQNACRWHYTQSSKQPESPKESNTPESTVHGFLVDFTIRAQNSNSGSPNISKKYPNGLSPRVYPVPVVGYTRVPQDEDAMASALYRYGPLSAALNSASMANYKARSIDQPTNTECDPRTLDHTVLIVGYNEYISKNPGEKRVKYWIIKNSWGVEWGDNGFYYLERGRNACGIASDVALPFVDI